jgi:hypothetical protein
MEKKDYYEFKVGEEIFYVPTMGKLSWERVCVYEGSRILQPTAEQLGRFQLYVIKENPALTKQIGIDSEDTLEKQIERML